MIVRIEGQHAVKEATSTLERERLEREAAVLGALDHPGIVRLVQHDRASGRLVTAVVPGATLATTSLPAPELARVAAAVATTLADLHDQGCVHGGVTAEHVIVSHGGPVLCSFSACGPVASRDPADDVRALGRLVLRGLGGVDDAQELLRRAGSRRRSHRPPEVDALAAVARRLAGDPTPTAREAALELAEVAGGSAALRLPIAAKAPVTTAARLRGAARAGIALAATVIVVAGAHALLQGGKPTAPASRAMPPSTVATTTTGPDSDRVWPVATTALDYRDGVLTTPEGRFAVGGADDLAASVDLDCDGVASLIVLQRSSGSIVAFDRWPAGDEAINGRVLTIVAGAARFVLGVDQGCPTIAVVDGDGRRHEVVA